MAGRLKEYFKVRRFDLGSRTVPNYRTNCNLRFVVVVKTSLEV